MIINQVNGMFEAKESRMNKYLNKVRQHVKKFKKASFVQLLREENMEANSLAKATLAREPMDEFEKF